MGTTTQTAALYHIPLSRNSFPDITLILFYPPASFFPRPVVPSRIASLFISSSFIPILRARQFWGLSLRYRPFVLDPFVYFS